MKMNRMGGHTVNILVSSETEKSKIIIDDGVWRVDNFAL